MGHNFHEWGYAHETQNFNLQLWNSDADFKKWKTKDDKDIADKGKSSYLKSQPWGCDKIFLFFLFAQRVYYCNSLFLIQSNSEAIIVIYDTNYSVKQQMTKY